MKSKDQLLKETYTLVTQLGEKPSNQIKWALNYLRRVKDLASFKKFLDCKHASFISQRHWERAVKSIKNLTFRFNAEELLYILAWANRTRKYYYPGKEK